MLTASKILLFDKDAKSKTNLFCFTLGVIPIVVKQSPITTTFFDALINGNTEIVGNFSPPSIINLSMFYTPPQAKMLATSGVISQIFIPLFSSSANRSRKPFIVILESLLSTLLNSENLLE